MLSTYILAFSSLLHCIHLYVEKGEKEDEFISYQYTHVLALSRLT